MKKNLRALILFMLSVGCASGARAAGAAETRVFELRTYTTAPGKLDALLARFREHTMTIFARHGMENVAYWVPADAKDGAGEKLVYLLAHRSREAAKASWAAFSADPEWQAVRKASEADGKIVTKVDAVFLAPTDYCPAVVDGGGKTAAVRVFELRTYTASEGKLDALDARFRGGETALFAKNGMTGVGYFHPLDAEHGAGHTLIYVLAHASRDAAATSWKAFSGDPAWVQMKATSEKDGKLTAKTESMFLTPTDFSPMK